MAEELERFLNHEPILAKPANSLRAAWIGSLRHPWSVTASATVIILGLVGFAFRLWQENACLVFASQKIREKTVLNVAAEPCRVSCMPIPRLIHKWVECFLLATALPIAAAESPKVLKAAASRHWAFVNPQRPGLPHVKKTDWPRNAIDRFVLARLEKETIEPSSEADQITLARRVCLDLTGLPPTPAELQRFLSDPAPDAYERLVERLLQSPHHGERWGRWWLDIARYADSNGYSIDAPRSIWPYRDWVVRALNRDQPFDQFVVWQLAGDLLPEGTLEQKIATGFHRNTQINQEGGIDKEQFRTDSVFDRVATTGSAFLGLTIGCAQCHDHKFDPITQKEFYRLFAFFNNADEPDMALAPPSDVQEAARIEAEITSVIHLLPTSDASIWERMLAWERSMTPLQRQAQTEQVRTVFDVGFELRTVEQKRIVLAAFVEQAAINKNHQADFARKRLRKPRVDTTMVMSELPQPRQTQVFVKGDFTRLGELVVPGVPAVLHPFPASEPPNRLGFARWLVSPENPLLARVTVNRVWQQFFGKGLVETENDFGSQGAAPSHFELLDWLATEFVSKGWSLKSVHRLIVCSTAYRQSSRVRLELNGIDPYNRLIARQSRLRLDAEIVRDVGLSASGLLSHRVGGPPVFPPQPDGVMSLGQVKREWKPSVGSDRYRRGLYTFFFRATPHPALSVFDAPDSFSTCTRRLRSNTPLQALTMLNDDAAYEFARELASRILREGGSTDAERLAFAFRLCVSRAPAPEEDRLLTTLLGAELEELNIVTGNTRSIHSPSGLDAAQFAAWTTLARVVMNLDETITRE